MRKKIIIFLTGAALCMSVAWYWYNKPRSGVESKTTDVSVTAKDLIDKYQATEAEANKLYLDKVIEVSGKVDDIIISENDAVIILGLQGMWYQLPFFTCNLFKKVDYKKRNAGSDKRPVYRFQY